MKTYEKLLIVLGLSIGVATLYMRPAFAQSMYQNDSGQWVNSAGGNIYGDSNFNIDADPNFNINADPNFNIDADPNFNINADPNFNINADPNFSIYGEPKKADPFCFSNCGSTW